MGLFDSFMGNASKINKEELAREFSPMLADNEHIEQAFAVFRDKWVFTNRRLIILNVQGMTGKKREYMSIPYRSIVRYSIETAGTFDLDAELKIWLSGSGHSPLNRNSTPHRICPNFSVCWLCTFCKSAVSISEVNVPDFPTYR